ncbi:MAG: type IV secretion system protein, partial [Tsuneonella sp.]
SSAPTAAPAAAATAAMAADRRIPVSSFAVAPAANDAGPAVSGGGRDTRVITREVASAGAQVAPLSASGASRTRGIGSRFRAPNPRSTEKMT